MGKVRLQKIDGRLSHQTGGRQPRNFTGGTFMENLDTYNLILKLGQLGAYDTSRRIKGPDGEFVQNTDIAHLIEEAMRPSRVVNGADAFIDLLVASKIDPGTIANDTIRAKLIRKLQQPPASADPDPTNDSDQDDDDDNTIIDEPSGVSNTRQPIPQEISSDGRRNVVRLERINVNDYMR
jgi:hypothetical protein